MTVRELWHKQPVMKNRLRLAVEGCVYIPLILLRLAGALVGVALLVVALLATVPADAQGLESPAAATIPAFRFARRDGRMVTKADVPARKLVLFVFFDPDCDHCKRALSHMDSEVGDYRGAFLYFVSMESQEKIDKFVATYAPHLAAQRNVLFLRDAGGGYMLGFHPIRFPSLFLYSPEHKLLDYEDNEETLFRIKRSMAAFAGAGK